VQILKQIEYFEDFDNEDLRIIVANYMEEIFLDPDRLVIKPKDVFESFFVVVKLTPLVCKFALCDLDWNSELLCG